MARYCHECGSALHSGGSSSESPRSAAPAKEKKPRKASAYSKRYGREFRRLMPKYKTKSGSWRKGGYKALVRAAHKAARK